MHTASPAKKSSVPAGKDAAKKEDSDDEYISEGEDKKAKYKARKQFQDDDGFIYVDTKKKQEEDLHYGRGGYRQGRYHRGGYNQRGRGSRGDHHSHRGRGEGGRGRGRGEGRGRGRGHY